MGNNTCKCHHGWSGAHCEIPPSSPPNPNVGNLECGNWGVFGELVLGASGFAPTCECHHGMMGARCERECNSDTDCGTGTCDEFGRCICAKSCLTKSDCGWGECASGKCTNGWTGVQCGRPLTNECAESSDCGQGGECVKGTCVCDKDHTGLRCETELVLTGEPCTYTEDCRDAVLNDICVSQVCRDSGRACTRNADCRVTCREGTCTYPSAPPEMSEQELSDLISSLVDQLLTADVMAQLVADAMIEEVLEKIPAAASKTMGQLKRGGAALKKSVARAVARRSSTTAASGVAPVATRGMVSSAAQNISNYAARKGITAHALKMGTKLAKGVNVLWAAIQVVGMVLDVDDAAGFNAQVPQGGVDMYMEKMLQSVNNDPTLREAGVHFPREYLPQDTLEWRLKLSGDVAEDEQNRLMLDYIDHLDVNSNGKTIIRKWTPPTKEVVRRNQTLWSLAGKNTEAYSGLSKWWWLILLLTLVVLITVSVGIGLSSQKRRS